MLHMVTGPSGSGKTTFLYEQAARLAREGRQVLFIVPEQSTFIAERKLYSLLKGQTVDVEVLSFTRLADKIFREIGGLGEPYLSDTGRFVLMSIALEELKDMISVYARHIGSAAFIAKVVDTVEEMKNAGLTPENLSSLTFTLPEGALKEKIAELSLIYDLYNTLVGERYVDPLDALSRAADRLSGQRFLKERCVLIDSFDGFTAPEYAMLKRMIADCPELYISLSLSDGPDPLDLWSGARMTKERLVRSCRDEIGLSPEQIEMGEPKRFHSPALLHMEKNIMRQVARYTGDDLLGVRLFAAPNPFDELCYIAGEVSRLVRDEGMRYRDILVITRNWERYLPMLPPVLERYGIPYFLDARSDICAKPLTSLAIGAVKLCSGGLRTQPLLTLARSAALDIDPEELGLLENYCYTWGIEGTAWERTFKNHPDGMQEGMDDRAAEKLARINACRSRLIVPLKAFQNAIADKTGEAFATGLYQYFLDTDAGANLSRFAQTLPSQESKIFLEEQSQLWDAMVDILDLFATRLGGQAYTKDRLAGLFEMAVASLDIGRPPEALDQLLIGQADRVRPDNPRVVFVIGATDGDFPKTDLAGGLLSDSDRQRLAGSGVELLKDGESFLSRERFFCYSAVTCASERVIISYPKRSASGEELLPSPLFSGAAAIFPQMVKTKVSAIDGVLNLETAADALSGCYRDDTPWRATLEAFLRENGGDSFVRLIDSAARKSPQKIEDKGVASRLFGENMLLSPSRIERYYNCPFSFFVQSGLGIRARRQADVSPVEVGSLIHQILEEMLARHGGKLATFDREELRAHIRSGIEAYIAARVSDTTELGQRLSYLFSRLVEPIEELLLQLIAELGQSLFVPAYFELPVRGGSDVEPVTLTTGGGITVRTEGVIDRVDIAEVDDQRYVRVVDYKTGKKNFSLSDVYHGLNMQMLIYLFSVCQNGRGELHDVQPAGILYMPSKGGYLSTGRDVGREELLRKHREQYRMKGIVLNEPHVIRAMEPTGKGEFIPVRLSEDDAIQQRSAVISRAELERLQKLVEERVTGMADLLCDGRVEACPASGVGYSPCQYCDYKRVCGFEDGDPVRPVDLVERTGILGDDTQKGGEVDGK